MTDRIHLTDDERAALVKAIDAALENATADSDPDLYAAVMRPLMSTRTLQDILLDADVMIATEELKPYAQTGRTPSRCPHCKATIETRDAFCRFCGSFNA